MCRLHEYKAMTRMQVAATLDRAQSMLDMHDKSRSYKQQDAQAHRIHHGQSGSQWSQRVDAAFTFCMTC